MRGAIRGTLSLSGFFLSVRGLVFFSFLAFGRICSAFCVSYRSAALVEGRESAISHLGV